MKKNLSTLFTLSILTSIVHAQVQIDPSAQANQKPTIINLKDTSGGTVPIVNIQTPRNGVSHNVYKQFDVLPEGVILNNSQKNASSLVKANPFLKNGAASVILNEVRGAATRFEGNLEVIGKRADVIIANPAGINIKGGGFINVNRGILTTGKPIIDKDGTIKNYLIEQGKITVAAPNKNNLGLGGDDNNAKYIDILTRALEVNAKIYAEEDITVLTGSNIVEGNFFSDDADGPGFKSLPNKINANSKFALDVKNLGGMYANNIYLLGTEKGLGVQNAGVLKAVNDIDITSAGKIENQRGQIETTGFIDRPSDGFGIFLKTTSQGAIGDINSRGLIKSNGVIVLDSSHDINLYTNKVISNQKFSPEQENVYIEKLGNPKGINLAAKHGIKIHNSAEVISKYNIWMDVYGTNEPNNPINFVIDGRVSGDKGLYLYLKSGDFTIKKNAILETKGIKSLSHTNQHWNEEDF